MFLRKMDDAGPPPRFLLLVPPAPSDRSFKAVKTAFADTVSQVLKETASHSGQSKGAAILEIAFACPHLVGKARTPRSAVYNETQRQISLLYKLVVVVAASEEIDIEDEHGVDVRIIPVAWDAGKADGGNGDGAFGPVVDIRTLAQSKRPWEYAFGVEGDAGEAMVKAFVGAKGSGEEITHVAGTGTAVGEQTSGSRQAETSGHPDDARTSDRRHFSVAVGGTFDHLHIGHKLLLTMTLFAVDGKDRSASRIATIGVTGDQLLQQKKHAEVLEDWDERQKAIEDFCDSVMDFSSWPSRKQVSRRDDAGPNGKSVDLRYPDGLEVRCTEIQDPFGPTITDEAITALVISGETKAGGQAVNQKRDEKGWQGLDMFEVDVLDADEGDVAKEGFEAKISSTAIREKIAAKASR